LGLMSFLWIRYRDKDSGHLRAERVSINPRKLKNRNIIAKGFNYIVHSDLRRPQLLIVGPCNFDEAVNDFLSAVNGELLEWWLEDES